MDEAIQLPPAPLTVTQDERPLTGAPVQAHLMNGEVVHGTLRGLREEQDCLSLLPEGEGESVDIAFSDLRALVFSAPVPATDWETGQPAAPLRHFHLVFSDGQHDSGEARSLSMNKSGLHIFRVCEDGATRRLFVPRAVLGQERAAPPRLDSGATAQAVVGMQAPESQSGERGTYYCAAPANSQQDLKAALRQQSSYPSRRLGELLVSEGLISTEQLDAALEAQKRDRHKRLGQILVEMGVTTDESIHTTLAHKLGVPFVKLREFDIDPEVLPLVSGALATKHTLMPLLFYEDHLVVAMEDPADIEAIDLLRFSTGHIIEVAVSTREDIAWAIDKHYGALDEALGLDSLLVGDQDEDDEKREMIEAEKLGKEKPVVRLVNGVILDGIRRRASDIHIHPTRKHAELSFRVDGNLIKIRNLDKRLLPAVVSRVKIIGRMDISERRLPQDGRSRVVYEGVVVDLRISVIPTVNGESVVIRILNTQVGLKTISELGFNEHDAEALVDMLHKSYGLILVTGPTGSGKSTTLYAALQEVRTQNVNIITVEEPVEYQMEGIEQIQVNRATNYTFARALRHILRHDPDVIMIGEIRDEETGKIAIESSLTGHLVLSTLHTNDAASAVTRMLEMGIEPYLLSATLLGVLAQRLVRCNCPHCIDEEPVDAAVRRTLEVGEDEVFYRGQGCDYCNHTGYKGRMAVYELLVATQAVRTLIKEGISKDELKALAFKEGMVTLTSNALQQARQRKTSLAEVYRVRLE